jgi:hypothetical protein
MLVLALKALVTGAMSVLGRDAVTEIFQDVDRKHRERANRRKRTRRQEGASEGDS